SLLHYIHVKQLHSSVLLLHNQDKSFILSPLLLYVLSLVCLYVNIDVKENNSLCENIHKKGANMNKLLINEKLKEFYIEDIGHQDITATTIFPNDETTTAYFYAKDAGMLAGVTIIERMYTIIDRNVKVTLKKADGEAVKVKETIAEV